MFAAIGVVCFGGEMGCLEQQVSQGGEADVLLRASSQMFSAVQKTTVAFPWYALFRTKLYKQFVDARNECGR